MSKAKEQVENYSLELANKIKTLLDIHEAMPKDMPFNAALEIEVEDGRLLFASKKQIKVRRQELLHEIEKGIPKKFKQFQVESRKIYPSDFKGVYKPVVVYDGMASFFKEVNLGTTEVGNQTSDPLIDSLPCIKQGYGLRNSFQLLLYLSVYVGDCQDEKERSVFHPTEQIKTLLQKYPCGYINSLDFEGKFQLIPNKKKASMMEALEHRLNKLDDKNFTPDTFKMYVFTILMSLNIYKAKDLQDEIKEALNNEELREQMLKEYKIIETKISEWKEYNKTKNQDNDDDD